MPKQVDADAQRREILGAAREAFARSGVRGVGLSQVARAAGMGRSSLYHYFPDKDALVRGLVEQALDAERALFLGCLRGEGSSLERIERLLDASGALFDEWARVGRLLLDLRTFDARGFGDFFAELRAELAAVIREGQAAGELRSGLDPVVGASLLIAVIDGLLLQHLAAPDALPPTTELAEPLREALRPLLLDPDHGAH